MALGSGIFMALSSALCLLASACPQSASNPTLGMVTAISAECFEACPQMCEPLDRLVAVYVETMDANAVKVKICAAPGPFTCMFEPKNFGFCKKVLEAGTALGVQLPMSTTELSAQCGTDVQNETTSIAAASTQSPGRQFDDVGDNATKTTTLLTISAATRGRGWGGAPFAHILVVVAFCGRLLA